MQMNFAFLASPGQGRDEESQQNPSNPLERHYFREKAIGVSNNLLPVLFEQLFRPPNGIIHTIAEAHFEHIFVASICGSSVSEQPKTRVWFRFGASFRQR